jgi:uncharacterized protein YlbG (UPF0298 family)
VCATRKVGRVINQAGRRKVVVYMQVIKRRRDLQKFAFAVTRFSRRGQEGLGIVREINWSLEITNEKKIHALTHKLDNKNRETRLNQSNYNELKQL